MKGVIRPRTVCEQVLFSLENNPEEWNQNKYQLYNSELGIYVWTSNGVFSVEALPYGRVTLIEKIRIWKAVKRFHRYYQYTCKEGK